MNPWLIALVVVGLVLLLVLVWAVVTYNGLIRLRNLVQEAWRQIDVELQRRHALVPNLVETVKGYATHEREVFEQVTAARAAAVGGGAGPQSRAQNENALSSALSRLFAVAENYPQLRASENFSQLQVELTNTEDRIAAGRRFYNANVRELNTKVETFPPNIVAGIFSFRRAEYFEANDPVVRAAPNVSFTRPDAPAALPESEGGPSFGGQRGGYDPRRDA